MSYSVHNQQESKKRHLLPLLLVVGIVLFLLLVVYIVTRSTPIETVEDAVEQDLIVFDSSISTDEQATITEALEANIASLEQPITISAQLAATDDNPQDTMNVYLPVTAFGSVLQATTLSSLQEQPLTISSSVPVNILADITALIEPDSSTIQATDDPIAYEEIRIIPFEELDATHQLLSLDGSYYLDDFSSGAIFRSIAIDSPGVATISMPDISNTVSDEDIYSVNLTGVTALTREIQRKLPAVGGDPLYFSADIGEFLADADLTHVSNEVSFADTCPYSRTLFCSPPEFIETLKASGVDVVELTGNHNNDLGADLNTATIDLYESLGWGTVGGGRNLADAREPFIDTQKDTTLAFLAYNYPDSPNGAAVATETRAGANPFDFSYASIEADIVAAQAQSDFVLVSVQFWECYSYPNGYVEFPECDVPIGEQEATFKQLIDLGADMVIGSSAHQPQTYELYNGKPIYYGLGNLYFEQTSWPGTERGLVLTNYFNDGNLIQTKITPTVYDNALQTRVMTADEAAFLLDRLKSAR